MANCSVKAMCSMSLRNASRIYPPCSAISSWHRATSIEPKLNVQPDGAHQLDAIALGDDAGPQLEVELELAVHQFVLKMDILNGARFEPGYFREIGRAHV